ncbi:MAG: Hsp70 family protein [Frankiaceae bacterium]|nr:Hsp70 family protein [Frankiaceae bacterium]MBV9872831.1 Hsp70 family protein [Frankiaceae bacterium]
MGDWVGYYIGVDLGTTYTAAAVARDDRVEVAALGNHSTAVSSVLWVGEQGDVLVGDAAQRRALSDPARVAREFKRRLGDTTPLLLGGTPYSAEALSAKLLSWVVAEVTRTEGAPPDGVAVTHPANWGSYKKDLLAQAVRLADLPAATTLTEPQAAAIFYASQQRVEAGDVVAVFDLGGGTFDAAVIRKVDDGRFDILGEPEGIERLGGIDFDDAVYAHVTAMAQEAIDGLDPDDPTAVTAVARLREECVEAKEVLSSDTETTVPVILPSMSTEVRLTRAEFEDMIRPRIEDAIGAMRRSLATAEVEPKDVKAILLVGGSSRIPLIAQMVSAAFGRPVAVDAHPKNAIAMGAAIAARTAAEGPVAEAAAVEEPPLPVQPERDTTAVLGSPLADAELAPTTPLVTPPSVPPPPPTAKGGRSKAAMILPALLGLALVAGGAYYMFGRDKGHDHNKSKASSSSGTSGSSGSSGSSSGGTPTTAPTPHEILTEDLLLNPASDTTPVDSHGSIECQNVAAWARGVDPSTAGSNFQTQCVRVTWQKDGSDEQVVAAFTTTADGSLSPRVEILTQDASGMWIPVLDADGSAESFSKATISDPSLTGSGEVDPEFVVNWHKNDGAQQTTIVQSNNGVPAVIGQTIEAFQASLVISGSRIVIYGAKTDGGDLRQNTITWNSSQGKYFGLFNYDVHPPVPSSSL